MQGLFLTVWPYCWLFLNFVLFAVQFSPPAERAPAVELNLMSIQSFLPFRKIVQKEAKEKGVSFLSVP